MSRNLLRGVATLAVVALAVSIALHLWPRPMESTTATQQAGQAQQRYHCPMHPTIVSDRPGDCPICGMRLVPIEEEPEAAATDAAHSGHAGSDAGMATGDAGRHEGGSTAVDGRARVQLSERKRQLIGVKTAIVERRPLARTIRTVGRVTYDETHLHHVHTKISGWVEKLFANATGEYVQKGEPLLTIYSPELVASAQEYLLALHARNRLGASVEPSIQRSSETLVSSARQRLLLFDLTAQQIDALESRGEVPTTMTLYAPISGHIIERNVTQGEQIDPGMNLLDIADLARVWVLADIYEYELPFLHLGQAATMDLSYLPGRSFTGKVSLIYPVLSEQTRTIKARLEFANEDYSLRPEMYAEVEISADLGERVVVPASAVINSGVRDIAFVERADGSLEPREITLGVRLPDSFEVLDGLAAGETVVTSGNFLVDSESKLKAALAASVDGGSGGAAGHAH